MEAPAKRAFTADVHDAILASNAPRHDFISDDLTARLQNVGSRVRRSVAEGYTTPAPSPLTQSPVKQHHTTPTAFIPSSNQILQSVFGTPTRFGATGGSFGMRSPSPSPSPRKRTREDDRAREKMMDMDTMECCDSSGADDFDSDSDDEVLITPHLAADGFPNVMAGGRPMRPLRRPRISQPVFGAAMSPVKVAAVQPAPEVAMDHLPHALHRRVPIPVTVGGGDNFSGQV